MEKTPYELRTQRTHCEHKVATVKPEHTKAASDILTLSKHEIEEHKGKLHLQSKFD